MKMAGLTTVFFEFDGHYFVATRFKRSLGAKMTFFTLILTAMADEKTEGTLWMPPSVSTLAEGVDDTFYFIYWVCLVFFFVLMGAMFYFAVVFKKKSDADKTLDLKGSHTIELVWSVFPSFLLVAMFVMGFQN